MSHFAEIDGNGIVKRVIVAEKNFINTGYVGDEFNWIQTSYNGNFRKQFAGIGFTYDKVNDVFIEPQPHPSWTLDSNHDWQPPTPRPNGNVLWDEDTLSWKER
jgi:hypothetical protein